MGTMTNDVPGALPPSPADRREPAPNHILAYLLLSLTSLFWSGNFLIGRAIRGDAPPLGLAFWRWAAASTLMVVLAWPHLRRDWRAIRRHWRVLLLFGLVGITQFNAFTYAALQRTTAINAFLMQSLIPVLVVGFSFLLYRESISRVQLVGVLLSLSGAVLVIVQGDWHVMATLALNRGDLFAFLAVAGYALYTTLLRRKPAIQPLAFNAAIFVVGALGLLPPYLVETWLGRSMPVTWTTVGAVSYVAIFPSILAYAFYNRGVEEIGPSRASLFIHLMPVFGSILAMLLLGERLSWYHGAGFALIAAGLLLATRTLRRAA